MKTTRFRTPIKSTSLELWLLLLGALMTICASSQLVTICSGAPTQTRLSGNHSTTGTTNNKHNTIVEQVKKNGQLESFSMEATGLGDLEEADAIRKMMRRSATKLSSLKSAAVDNDQLRNQVAQVLARVKNAQDVNDHELALALAMYRSEASARDNLARYLAATPALLTTRNSKVKNRLQGEPQTKSILDVDLPQVEPPIMISRRTAEEFEGADQDLVDLDDDKLGEFSSRISFLTTRKIQPEEMLVGESIMDMLEKIEAAAVADHQPFLTAPRDGAMVAGGGQADSRPRRRDHIISKNDALKSKNHEIPTKDEQPILIGANSNYLPRVARAASSPLMM